MILFAWWATYLYSELKLPPASQRQAATKPLHIRTPAATSLLLVPAEPSPQASAMYLPTSDQPRTSVTGTNQLPSLPAAALPDDKALIDQLGMNVVSWLLAEDFAMAQTILQEEKGKNPLGSIACQDRGT